MPNDIARQKNLGPKSAAMLSRAGIETIDDLRDLGPVVAYLAVKQTGERPGLNLLWAITAALEDIHWLEIAPERKQSLLAELESLTK